MLVRQTEAGVFLTAVRKGIPKRMPASLTHFCKSPLSFDAIFFRRFESCRIPKGICLWLRTSLGTKTLRNVSIKATVRQGYGKSRSYLSEQYAASSVGERIP